MTCNLMVNRSKERSTLAVYVFVQISLGFVKFCCFPLSLYNYLKHRKQSGFASINQNKCNKD